MYVKLIRFLFKMIVYHWVTNPQFNFVIVYCNNLINTNFQRRLARRHDHRHHRRRFEHSPAAPAESALPTVLGTAPGWRLPRATHCRSLAAPRLSSTATKCREECMRCTLIDLCPLLEFLTGGCAVLHSDSRMAFNYCSKTCFSNCAKHKDIW